MDTNKIRHKKSLIELLKIEIGECYNRIRLYKKAEMEAFTSFSKFIQTEEEKIEDYEEIILTLTQTNEE